MDKKKSTLVYSFLITTVLVLFLLTHVSLEDFISTLANIKPLYIFAGFAVYSCTCFLRALRFHILLNKEIGVFSLFKIVCVHNMVNNILPARTGELSYIYLLQKHHGKNTGEGIATLVVARASDYIAISLLFMISCISIRELPPTIQNIIWLIALVLVSLSIIFIGIIYSSSYFEHILNKTFSRINFKTDIKTDKIERYLLKKTSEVVESFEKIKSNKVLVEVFALSLLIWLSSYLIASILLAGMNVYLPFSKVALGISLICLTLVLPIQSVGGFGTTEGFWTAAFVMLGVSLNSAIISGFSYHIILFVYFMVLGLYGFLTIKAS